MQNYVNCEHVQPGNALDNKTPCFTLLWSISTYTGLESSFVSVFTKRSIRRNEMKFSEQTWPKMVVEFSSTYTPTFISVDLFTFTCKLAHFSLWIVKQQCFKVFLLFVCVWNLTYVVRTLPIACKASLSPVFRTRNKWASPFTIMQRYPHSTAVVLFDTEEKELKHWVACIYGCFCSLCSQ